ncbi:MAG: RNA polymerase sigma factor, partial [Pyrinomonadaceae bacterium]
VNDTKDASPVPLAAETLTLEQRVTALFEQMRTSVYRYLMVVLGSASEAEDVTQEAFLRLHRYLLGGQDILDARAWVFRVAHNLAIKYKLKGRHVISMDSDSWEDLSRLRTDSRPNPEQSLISHEFRQRFESALEKLSPLQRQCLILRAEGLKYQQIAEILNTNVSQVAQSLRRGLSRMRKGSHE